VCDVRDPLVRLLLAAVALALAVLLATGTLQVPNFAESIADAVESIGPWVFLAVPALVFLETSAFAGWLVHGELALLAGGFAVAERGVTALGLMIVVVWAAAVAGDVVSLTAGRALGRPFLERRLGAHRVARVDGFFGRHGGKALFLGRFSGFLRATMAFVIGSSGVPVRRLLPFSVVSGLVWGATFLTLGYAASESFERAGDAASRVALVALLVIAAALIVRGRWTRDGGATARGDRPSASAPQGP
jgi:membrane protein DedA with SNARE-associated domain